MSAALSEVEVVQTVGADHSCYFSVIDRRRASLKGRAVSRRKYLEVGQRNSLGDNGVPYWRMMGTGLEEMTHAAGSIIMKL